MRGQNVQPLATVVRPRGAERPATPWLLASIHLSFLFFKLFGDFLFAFSLPSRSFREQMDRFLPARARRWRLPPAQLRAVGTRCGSFQVLLTCTLQVDCEYSGWEDWGECTKWPVRRGSSQMFGKCLVKCSWCRCGGQRFRSRSISKKPMPEPRRSFYGDRQVWRP